jgi:soluble lytic murein transglycosylase-like protein
MTGMLTRPPRSAAFIGLPAPCALALALAFSGGHAWAGGVDTPAGAAAGGHSPYRLRMPDAPAYRMRKESTESYRLAPEYRAMAREQAQAAQEDAVSQALGEEARLQLAAQRAAEMAAKPHARQIDRAARAAELDPALVHALIYVESRHSAKAVSVKGAVGLMQVLPDTGARYGIDPTRTTEMNLKAGTRYLRDLMRRFDDRLDLALAAYNAGEGAVERYSNKVPPYRETQDYVRSVLAKYSEWRSPPPLIAGKVIRPVNPAAAPRAATAGAAPDMATGTAAGTTAGTTAGSAGSSTAAMIAQAPRSTRLDSVTIPAAPAPESTPAAPVYTLAQLQQRTQAAPGAITQAANPQVTQPLTQVSAPGAQVNHD